MKKLFFSLAALVVLVTVIGWTADTQTQNGKKIMLSLTGAAEVPTPGDPDGTGMAVLWLNQGQGTITYEIWVSDVDMITAGHIHEAPEGSAGPVAVNLEVTFDANGYATGTVEASKELIKEIRKNASAYYLNLHNPDYPGGALRAQLK